MKNTYEHIKIAPANQGFGAGISGVDLGQPLDAAVLEEVKRAWTEHSVVYFPEQPLEHEQLEAFALQFGGFGFDPFIEAMPDHPHILELRREATEKTGKLPMQHSVVVRDSEYRFAIQRGPQGFVKVTGERCKFP